MLKNRKFFVVLLAFAVLAALIVSCKKQDTGVVETKPADKVVVSEPTSTASTPAKSDSTGTTPKAGSNASDVSPVGDVGVKEGAGAPVSGNREPEMKTDDSLKSGPKGRPSIDTVLKVWALSNIVEEGQDDFYNSDNVSNPTYEATSGNPTYGADSSNFVDTKSVEVPKTEDEKAQEDKKSDTKKKDSKKSEDAKKTDSKKVDTKKQDSKKVEDTKKDADDTKKQAEESKKVEDAKRAENTKKAEETKKVDDTKKVEDAKKQAEGSKKENQTKQPITVKVLDRAKEEADNYGVGDVDVALVDGIYYPIRHTDDGSYVVMSDVNEDVENVADVAGNAVSAKNVKVAQPKAESKAVSGNSDKSQNSSQPKSNTKVVADKNDESQNSVQPKSDAKVVADKKNGKTQNAVQPESNTIVVDDNNKATAKSSVKADKKAAKAESAEAKKDAKIKENKEPSDFFEGDWNVSAYVSPFAYQSVSFKYFKISDGSLLDLVSKYGFGGRVKGTYLLKSGLYAAADISLLSFEMKDEGWTTDYLSLIGMLKAGYKFGLNEKFYLLGETGAGANFSFRNGEVRTYPIIGVGLGGGYNLNEKWSIEGIVDGTWYWQRDKSGEAWGAASTWGLYTFLGATYKF